ncbi:MAG: septum site-determining protein MinC [Candidatus Saccharibacteria bacterium]
MISEDIVIREPKGSILIYLNPESEHLSVKDHLLSRIEKMDDMVGSQVVVDVGPRRLTKREAQEIQDVLEQSGLHLKTLLCKGRKVKLESRETVEATPLPAESGETSESEAVDPGETMLVRKTVRSGQKLIHAGNIVVIGDVNPGAEIVAGGSIVIMGSIRGLAHAGSMGDEKAVVTALRLTPTQLRIANHITRPPEGEPAICNHPEIAYIKDGRVVIDKFKL